MFQKLIDWWYKPPARERILAALDTDEWRPGLQVWRSADVFAWNFYPIVLDMEENGLVESKWDSEPIDPARGGYRRRLYRKIT